VVKAVLFDLGDTIIEEQVDDKARLDELHLHAQPEAREVVELLSHIVVLGLVTDTETSPEPSVRKALHQLGFNDFFSVVVTSQDVGEAKPSPRIFEEALRLLGVRPDETVMVGNDIDRDIAGAKRMGIRTILVTNSRYFDPRRAHLADFRVDRLVDIPTVIGKLQSEEPQPG
jgi:putative hydrolase of the HAD superfamily